MLFQPGKIAAASRLCWERGVALVVVGFPATPLMSARARVCISAAHTRADLERALQVPHPMGLPTVASRVDSLLSAVQNVTRLRWHHEPLISGWHQLSTKVQRQEAVCEGCTGAGGTPLGCQQTPVITCTSMLPAWCTTPYASALTT